MGGGFCTEPSSPGLCGNEKMNTLSQTRLKARVNTRDSFDMHTKARIYLGVSVRTYTHPFILQYVIGLFREK